MPRAFVGDDGNLYKACPQCIQDEMALESTLSKVEAEQRVAKRADVHFCQSNTTADGFQAWCKYHVNLKSKTYQKKRRQEMSLEERRAAAERRQRANLRQQRELRDLQEAVRAQLGVVPIPEETPPVHGGFTVRATPPSARPMEKLPTPDTGGEPEAARTIPKASDARPSAGATFGPGTPDSSAEGEWARGPEDGSIPEAESFGDEVREIVLSEVPGTLSDDELLLEEDEDLVARREMGEQYMPPPPGLER